METLSARTAFNDKEAQLRHFLSIEGPDYKQIINLDQPAHSIGRHSDNSIVLPFKEVSRYQATLVRKNNADNRSFSYWIVDGNLQGAKSTNGIYVNHKKCLTQELKHGDNISLASKIRAIYFIANASAVNSKVDGFKTSQIAPSPKKAVLESSKETVITPNYEKKEHNQQELLKLASFPSLNPCPIVETDLEGNLTYLNPAAELKFPNLKQVKQEHPIFQELPTQLRSKQGELLTREVSVGEEVFEQYVQYLPNHSLIRSYFFKITERLQAEAAIREREERYYAAIKQSNEGIYFVDATSKQIVEANPACCRLLGYTLHEILALTLYETLAEARSLVDSYLQQLANQEQWQSRWQHRRKEGSLVEVEVSASLVRSGKTESYCFVVRDIAEKRQGEEWLQERASHDYVTGLPRRKLFDEQLEAALANAKQQQQQMALMCLSLERFKNINDTLGHQVSDRLLQSFADRLKGCLRNGDMVARWGDEEFALLLQHLDRTEDVVKVGQRVLEALKQPFRLDQHRLYLRCSVGIAVYPRDGADAETLMKHAGTVFYRTK